MHFDRQRLLKLLKLAGLTLSKVARTMLKLLAVVTFLEELVAAEAAPADGLSFEGRVGNAIVYYVGSVVFLWFLGMLGV
jgi:hypothetical protein